MTDKVCLITGGGEAWALPWRAKCTRVATSSL